MSTTDPHWTAIVSALATPAIAILVGWVAFQQMRTAQAKLKLDLFERRIAVYEGVCLFLRGIMQTGNTSSESERRFLECLQQAKWLFGGEVIKYLDKTLWASACDLACLNAELDGMEPSAERTEKIEARATIKRLLMSQHAEIDSHFKPYLSFDKWR